MSREASSVTHHGRQPLHSVQCIPLRVCNRWGRPSWLQLDTSAGLESEIIFIFPSLGFSICSVVVIYCPVLRSALRPLDVWFHPDWVKVACAPCAV